ncbi:MAG: cell division protein FtsZ, partial [Pseudomonadota bacterium]
QRSPEQRSAQPSPAAQGNDAFNFVAPRPRAMGTPSPEAMARLQAAVSKAPATAQQPSARAAAPAAKPAERARFGIGSLISRMSGGGSAEAAQTQRAQPPVSSYDDEAEPASDQDRLEIPAFLRRQAN